MRSTLIFSGIWFIAGIVMGLGIESFFGANDILLPCGAANMLLGLLMLLLILRDERARQAFYGEGESGGLALAILVAALPAMTLAMGLIWWLMGQLFAS